MAYIPQPAEVIAIAGVAYGLIQAVKKQYPKLGGWYAMGLNILLNVAGDLMIAQPGQLKTSGFWIQVLLGAGSSAGLHGTISTMTTPTTAASTLAADTVQAAQQTESAVKAADIPKQESIT